MRGADDAVILMRAAAEQRVVLTFDKDFGELAFRQRLPASCGVILLRFTPKGREHDIQQIVAVLLSREDWMGAFWVVSDNSIRKRPLPVS